MSSVEKFSELSNLNFYVPILKELRDRQRVLGRRNQFKLTHFIIWYSNNICYLFLMEMKITIIKNSFRGIFEPIKPVKF